MDNDSKKYSSAFKCNKRSQQIFDYLEELSPIKKIYSKDGTSDNECFDPKLYEKYEKVREYLKKDSVLLQYLNPPKVNSIKQGTMPIFPFEFNKSQENAVRIAMNNDFSIIQGPPGTGKTQVILNIISNAILNGKTVLVVSNSNDAIKNVNEKLERAGLGFLTATLGKKENKDKFFEDKQYEEGQYRKLEERKEKLEEWNKLPIVDKVKLQQDLENLNTYFEATTRRAELKMKLSALDNEYTNFKKNLPVETSPSQKTLKISVRRIIKTINKLLDKQKKEEKLSNIYKLVLKYIYGIASRSYKDVSNIYAIETLKYALYQKEILYLKSKIKKTEVVIKDYENGNKKALKTLCNVSMGYLKKTLARRLIADKYKEFKENEFLQGDGVGSKNFEEFLKNYPVVFSTTYSAFNSKFGNVLYDYLIMDEASQVDIITGVLALSCAKRAVIVGDEKQLPNIINDKSRKDEKDVKSEKAQMDEVYKKYENLISIAYRYDNSFLSSVIKVFDESNCKVGNTLLREHYRCHPKIINFCNKQFYNNQLIIMTKENENDENNAICIRLNSERMSAHNNKNEREVDILKEDIWSKLSEEERKDDKLAIITPYNNQVRLIQENIGKTPSTVHKYQGQERDNVIISTVDDKLNPFSDDKQLLNVAISRAKKKLFLINSYSEEDRYRSNIGTFVDYAKNNNFDVQEEIKVNSIFDFLYSRLNEERLKYSNEKTIEKYKGLSPAEIAMFKCLDEIIGSDKRYPHLKFVFGYLLADIVLKTGTVYSEFLPEEKRYIENGAHIDFCIYNAVSERILLGIEVDGKNYHNNGLNTEKADYNRKLKKSIFEKLGIRFKEFETTGSGEKKKLKTILDSIEKERLENELNCFTIKEESDDRMQSK